MRSTCCLQMSKQNTLREEIGMRTEEGYGEAQHDQSLRDTRGPNPSNQHSKGSQQALIRAVVRSTVQHYRQQEHDVQAV